ncbi:uncharacterized protein OCT59_017139 [Rhizophagus irregularis]|uniref:uncharacterized protein n=1 Tax=Rhizophagus irregularis TaxID=588596 RepID=UPI003329517B|nr:hypothetical protein OCT59_017139 [Rhizophagus irregularis]
MIKQCWVKFAICSKAVFVESMSDNDYVRLDAMLQNLSINLLKVKFTYYIPHINKKNVELDFIKRENTLQSLRYLIDCGLLYNNIQINGKIKSLFDRWYLTSQIYSNEDIEEDQENYFTSSLSNYINIKVRGKWNKQKIHFQKYLSFTIIDDDTIIEENIKLQAGDVVEIEGKEDNDDIENEKWFARIQAIFVHRSNDNNYHISYHLNGLI